MKKLWEVIKKIGVWFATVLVAIFTVLFVKERRNSMVVSTGSTTADDSEVINAKAAKKRDEAVARIERADARSICEGYGTVCDTIADGKQRFRQRVVSTGSTTVKH